MMPLWRSSCLAMALLLLAFAGAFPPPVSASSVAITLIRPLGGEIVPGGTQYPIDWYAQHFNDPKLWTTIRLSTDGGATFPYFANADYVPGGPASHLWAVPNVNTTTARIRVCATAQDGDVGCMASTGDFTIRGTPPYLSILGPADGAHEVPLDEPIHVAATNVSTSTVAWTILPPVPLTDSWTGGTHLELSHPTPFTECIQYTLVLSGNSTGGSPLGFTSTFFTACPRPFIISTAPPDGAWNVSLDATVAVTFSAPMNRTSVVVNATPSFPFAPDWSGSDTILSLNHTVPLANCTFYSIQVVKGEDANGYWLLVGAANNTWSFMTTCSSPYIVSTDPADGETDVPLDAPLWINFSESVNNSTFALIFSPTRPFNFTWSDQNRTVLATHPAPFEPCTYFTFEVQAEDLDGNPLVPGPVPNPWTFKTVCVGPCIVSVDPANGAAGVALDADIVVTFSEGMDTPTVAWTIVPSLVLSGNWNFPTDTILTLSHTTPFAACTMYTIRITSGFSKSGRSLIPGPVPNPWSFSTGCPSPYLIYTNPSDGMVGVPVNANITVAFNEGMNTSTVAWTIDGGITLSGSWNSPTDTILTLTHTTPFAACTVYIVEITAGSSKTGFPLVPGPVPNPWPFTTIGPCPNPYIVSTVPSDGSVDVPVDAFITVTFSEPMNATTLNVTIAPAVILYQWSWTPNATEVVLNHTSPFQECVDYTVEILAAEDQTGDPLVPGPVPNPWTFSTVCTRPYIVSTDPSEGASEIPLDASVVVTFSEAMNDTSVVVTEPSLSFRYSWNTAKTVLTLSLDAGLFVPCTAYRFNVTGSDPDGNPLVPGPVPNPWTFSSDCLSLYVSAGVTSPLGGESWTGGSVHPVSYSISNVGGRTRVLTVSATYAYPSGGGAVASRSETVGPGGTVSGRFDWTVPSIDAADVVVNLTVTDAFGQVVWAESGPFEIDSTAPTAVSASPQGPHAPMDPTVVVTFSEPMRIPAGSPLAVTPPVATTVSWPAADRFEAVLSGTQPCTSYAVEVSTAATARLADDSDPGNPFAPLLWSFRTVCYPSVTLRTPSGGEDWSGGVAHGIGWDMADADDPALNVSFFLSADGGASFTPLMPPTPFAVGTRSTNPLFPSLDTANAVLRVDVADGDGNAATARSGVFTIDSKPPALLVSYPSNGSYGHKTTREIWFVWTERVDRASVEAAFSIAPDPGGVAFSWSVSNLGGDVLVVDHDPFRSDTTYTVRFSTAAKDDSVPGNPLPATLVLTFTTQPPPNVNPPVAKAVGKNQVPVGVPVRFDGSGSTGNITSYAWRIVDNQGRFVAALVGAIVNHTFQEHGRYSVTLIVTDANSLTDEDTLEVNVTSNPNLAGYVLAGGALLAAALAVSTEAGRVAVFSWLLVPLYARRKRNELLEHQTRGMIMGYILVHPGDTYTDIKRNLQLTNGTLSYHLAVLEREGLILSQFRGVHKLFFPRGGRALEDGGGLHEVQLRMLGAIREVPGLAVKDLAGAIGITSQHALYHLRALASKGKIRFERHGVRLRCYPEEPATPPEKPSNGSGPAD